jgi:hypothetical protein
MNYLPTVRDNSTSTPSTIGPKIKREQALQSLHDNAVQGPPHCPRLQYPGD